MLDKSKIPKELIFPKQEGIQPVNPFSAIVKLHNWKDQTNIVWNLTIHVVVGYIYDFHIRIWVILQLQSTNNGVLAQKVIAPIVYCS
jgi:hypothetical protein